MPLVECAVCGKRTYLEKTGVCFSSACSPLAAKRAEEVAEPEPVRERNVELVEGEPCPTCGKQVGRRTVKRG